MSKKIDNLLARLFRGLSRAFATKDAVASSDGVKRVQSWKPTEAERLNNYRFDAGLKSLGCFVVALISASFVAVFGIAVSRLDKCFSGNCDASAGDVALSLALTLLCLASIVCMFVEFISFVKLCFKSKAEFRRLEARAEKARERYAAKEPLRRARAEAERKKAEENAKMWAELWDLAKGLAAIVAVFAIVFVVVGGVVSFSGWFIGAFGVVAFLLLLILLFK